MTHSSPGVYRSVPRTAAFDNLAAGLFLFALALAVWRLWAAVRARNRGPVPEPDKDTAAARPASDRSAEYVALSIILLWFLMPLLFYTRSSVYLQNYYLVGQWPAHFILVGIGLDTAQRAAARMARRATTTAAGRAWRVAGYLLPALFLALVVFQVFFTIRYQNARVAGNGPPLQVRYARAIINTSRELLAAGPEWRLVGLGHGHQVENSDLALLQEFVDPARVMLADSELALPLPSPAAFYLDSRPGSLGSYSPRSLRVWKPRWVARFQRAILLL